MAEKDQKKRNLGEIDEREEIEYEEDKKAK